MAEENEGEQGGIHLITETVVATLLIVIYVTTGPLLRRFKIRFIHESSITMIIGILLTYLAVLINPRTSLSGGFKFDDVFFFTFILPLIIFSAGYNLRRDLFFKYFRYIAIFSITGTFISFFFTAWMTHIFNKHHWFYFTSIDERFIANVTENNTTDVSNITDIATEALNVALKITTQNITANDTEIPSNVDVKKAAPIPISFSLWEILLFSAAISSTDTVATTTLFDEETDQKLLSITFGDGVINDALCIALFKIVSSYNLKRNAEFSGVVAWEMLSNSIVLFIFSFILGTIIGMVSSQFLKKLKQFRLNRVQEISLLLLFAFISYTLSDWIHLSPIISLLSCGIFMSHYTFYNLSFQSREESYSISKVLDVLASAFAFSFLGLTAVFFTSQALSISFIIFQIILIFVTRFVNVFVQIWILKYIFGLGEDFTLKTSKKSILTLSGTIRGAVSFALAISIHTTDSKTSEVNREVLISSCIVIVMITTIIFGGIMPFIFSLIKSSTNHKSLQIANTDEEEELYTFLHPNFQKDVKKKEKELSSQELAVLKTQVSYWLGHYWVEFDDVCIKPKLVFNWPGVKEDNDALVKLIKMALHKYSVRKERYTIDTEALNTPEQFKGTVVEMNFMSSDKKSGDVSQEKELISEKIIFNSDSEKGSKSSNK